MSTTFVPLSVLFPNSIDGVGEFVNNLIFLLHREKMDLFLDPVHRQRWHRLFWNLSQLTVPEMPAVLRGLRFDKAPRECAHLEEHLEMLLSGLVLSRCRDGLCEYELPAGTAMLWEQQYNALPAEEKQFFLALALPLARIEGFRSRLR